jgi:hypothetical protein
MSEDVPDSLQGFLQEARLVEHAADMLGREWPGWAGVQARCEAFRARCNDIAGGRRSAIETIGFIGPKKAGKSTLLKLLIRAPETLRHIPAGNAFEASTERLVWVGPCRPEGMDCESEHYVPRSGNALVPLGVPYMLADSPGHNDRAPIRAFAARQALGLALVKVLVVRPIDCHTESAQELVRSAGRSTVLPVITQVRPGDDREVAERFVGWFAAHAPDATVLPPLVVEDFDLIETPPDCRAHAAVELAHRLRGILQERPTERRRADLLQGFRDQFREEIRSLASVHLRATEYAVEQLREAVIRSSLGAVRELLGSDDELVAGIRWAFRASLMRRTPGWSFPWTTLLRMLSLVSGATDYLPLAFLGSLPSLGAAVYRGVNNLRDGAQFQQRLLKGLTNGMEQHLGGALETELQRLEAAFRTDTGEGASRILAFGRMRLEPVGMDELQRRSTVVFEAALRRHGPSGAQAYAVAIPAFFVF